MNMELLHGYGGSSASELNIFCQPTEPKVKEGIWIQSPNKESTKDILVDSNIYTGGSWVENIASAPAPFSYGYNKAHPFSKDEYILFTPSFTGAFGSQKIWFYNEKTNTWRELKILFNNLCHGGAYNNGYAYVSNVGNSANIIKVNCTTGETFYATINRDYGSSYAWTGVHTFLNGKAFSMYENGSGKPRGISWVEVDSNMANNSVINMISTNSITTTINPSSIFEWNGLVYAVIDIGLYTINTINKTITQVATLPKSGYVTPFGNSLIIYSWSSEGDSIIYKYEINNTYTQLETHPQLKHYTDYSVVGLNKSIYFSGGHQPKYSGSNYTNRHIKYSLISKQYNENQIIIQRHNENIGKYLTQIMNPKTVPKGLYPRFTTGFNNAWLFKNSDLQEYPCYYGNGTSWVKFKN